MPASSKGSRSRDRSRPGTAKSKKSVISEAASGVGDFGLTRGDDELGASPTAATLPPIYPSADERPVSEAELLEFCFPTKPVTIHHPKSAARLFVFAQYGPLTDGQLMGGRASARHVVTRAELEMLLESEERADLLAVYVGEKATLSVQAQEEVLREARHLRSILYNYTRKELQAFFEYLRQQAGLPPGAPVPFGAVQRAVAVERAHRARQLRLLFPTLTAKAAAATPLQRGRTFKPIRMAQLPEPKRMAGSVLVSGVPPTADLARFQRDVLGERFGPVRRVFWRTDAAGHRSPALVVQFHTAAASAAALSQLEGVIFCGCRLHVSAPRVPPPDLGGFEAVEAMLSKNAYAIAQLGVNADDPGLRVNTLLMRQRYASRPEPTAHDGRLWDDLHALRGTSRPSLVDDRSSAHIADFVARPALSSKVARAALS